VLVKDAKVLDRVFDVCIVGAGPAGIACGLDCAARGLSVLILEAGGQRPIPGRPDVLAAEFVEKGWHDPVDIVAAQALGGSTHWWGGRSVPFDRADFATWPITYDDMQPWYERGAVFLGARGVHTAAAPGAFAKLASFDATHDETMCPQPNMSRRWGAKLRAEDGPTVFLDARVGALVIENGRIEGVRVRHGDAEKTVKARRVVLTCGGLGSLKLLLLAQSAHPYLFGGADGALGHGYMGHLNGSIADLEFTNGADVDAFSARLLNDGVDARRRILPTPATIAREHIGNIAFWLENGSNANPAHGSSVASAKYVAARAARAVSGKKGGQSAPLGPHFKNIARAPFTAAAGLLSAGIWVAQNKLGGPRRRQPLTKPVGERMWQMQYHAEQFADVRNRVSLSDTQRDSTGAPALKIDFRFTERDFESVVRAHELLDADLQASGAGRLKMHHGREGSIDAVRRMALDGYHQLGGAIMSDDPTRGVVDKNLRAHGLENLFVVSGAVLPTSSQANPTLTIVSLALRLAEWMSAGVPL